VLSPKIDIKRKSLRMLVSNSTDNG